MWYKKDFVIPRAIVPGPNKPGDLDLFLYPSLCHIAALQCEGLRIYDLSINALIPCSIPCVLFRTADSLGSVAMSGMVGHIGKYGCHLYCNMHGHCQDGDSHYYPAMALPRNYDGQGCLHPDITVDDLCNQQANLPQKYVQNLQYLLAADTLCYVSTRRLPDLGVRVLRISLVRSTSAYFKQRRASKQ